MKIQLLIVDDEELTKNGLTNYIDWTSLGITKVYSASNGLEALELTDTFVPDILLTDVKMPHMNGIELANRIRSLYPSCKLLFLSGYADKEYLKSAIDLKAEAYIEKPVVLNNVALAVSKVIQLIQKEKQASETQALQAVAMSESKKLMQIDIVWDLISPNTDWTAFREKYVPTYFTWQDNASYLASCIQLHNMDDSISDRQICQYLRQYLIDQCIFTEQDFFLGYQKKHDLVLVTSVTFSAFLHNALTKLQQIIQAEYQITSTIAIGPVVHQIDRIIESFQIAAQNLDFQYMYYNYRGILDCHFALTPRLIPEHLFDKKNHSLMTLERLLDTLSKEQYTEVHKLREKLYQLYVSFCRTVPVSWDEFKHYTMPDYMQIISYGMSSLEDLNHLDQYHPQIQKAIRFMLLNYAQSDLSIRTISEEVGLSQNYFCSLFKQNTDTTVGDYLLQIRMERVCFYLKNSDLKLYEIAEKVGIPDANYLNTLFKKQYHVTPTHYRKEGLS